MLTESSTLDQLWHHLEGLARAQQGILPHVAEVYEKIGQLAAERQRIEEEMMRVKAQPVQQEGEKGQPQAGNGSRTKRDELEEEIAGLLKEWTAFKEQNAQIKRTAEKILKRVPPGAPEADQLTRLAMVKGGGLTFEEIDDDLAVMLELAACRKRTGEDLDPARDVKSVEDPCPAEEQPSQLDKSAAAGPQEDCQGHALSNSVAPLQDVPCQRQAPKDVRRRGRPVKFSWEQKKEWVRRRDEEGESLVSLAREMYPEEKFTNGLRHRTEASLSRFRKQIRTECAAIDGITAKNKESASPRVAPQP